MYIVLTSARSPVPCACNRIQLNASHAAMLISTAPCAGGFNVQRSSLSIVYHNDNGDGGGGGDGHLNMAASQAKLYLTLLLQGIREI